MIQRFGHWIRLVAVATFTVLGLVATSGTARLSIVAIGAAIVAWCAWRLRGRGASVALPVELLFALLVGLSQAWSGPPSAADWAVRVAATVAVVAHCEWPRRALIAWAISVTSLASLAVGSTLALGASSSEGPVGSDLAGRMLQLLLHVVLAAGVIALLRWSARVVDTEGERLAEKRREEAVADAHRAAEREYLATLHDTACTTLFMVSVGAAEEDASWLPERARRDLDSVLSPEDYHIDGDVDVAESLEQIVADSGMPIDTDVSESLVLPGPAASAVVHGLREAIHNVRQHADGATATLRAGRDRHDTYIELTDEGPGFDEERVQVHRRGIADSIVGRMVAAGGRATVTSTPGVGTTVRWSFP